VFDVKHGMKFYDTCCCDLFIAAKLRDIGKDYGDYLSARQFPNVHK